MASQYDIVVQLDTSRVSRGTRQVDRELRRLQSSSDALGRSLQRAFGFISVGLIVRELLRLADAYTNLQNRLRTVTTDHTQLMAVQEQLLRVAQETRSSFTLNVTLYQRFSSAIRQLGLSHQDLLNFVRQLNQAVALSGVTTTEAAGALIQLSQGMSSGMLRGEELNSVMEQLGAVADIIARRLGTTRGGLRALAEQGKITGEVIFEAFRDAAEGLETRFRQAIPTVQQAFVVLENAFLNFVGEIDKALGLTERLARGMIWLSQNFELVAKKALALAIATAAIFSPSIFALIFRLIGSLLSFQGVLGVAIGVFVGFSAQALAFADNIKLSADGFATFGDVLRVFWSDISALFQQAMGWIKEFIGGVDQVTGASELSYREVILATAKFLDEFLTGMRVAIAAVPDSVIAMLNGLAAAIDTALNGIINGINKVIMGFNSVAPNRLALSTIGPVTIGSIEPFANKVEPTTYFRDVLARAEVVGRRRRIEEEFRQSELESMQFPPGNLGDPVGPRLPDPPSRDVTRRGERRVDLLARVNRELDREIQLLGMSRREQEIISQLHDIEEQFLRNKTPLRQAESDAIEQRLRQIQNLKEVVESVNEAIESTLNHIGDAFVDFAVTGKLSFKEMADSIIRDLLRIAWQAFVIRPLLDFAQNSAAGFLSGLALPGFAGGGDFMVKGNGGVDSKLVAFWATPGERVKIMRPGELDVDEKLRRLDGRLAKFQGGGDFLVERAPAPRPAGPPETGANFGPTRERSVVVNVINNTSEPVETRSRQEGGLEIKDIIVGEQRQALSDGSMDGVMRSRFGVGLSPRRR